MDKKVLDRLQALCSRKEYCRAEILQKALKDLESNSDAAEEIVESLVADGFVDVSYAGKVCIMEGTIYLDGAEYDIYYEGGMTVTDCREPEPEPEPEPEIIPEPKVIQEEPVEEEIPEEEILDRLWEEQSSYNPKTARKERRESSKAHKKGGRNERRWN